MVNNNNNTILSKTMTFNASNKSKIFVYFDNRCFGSLKSLCHKMGFDIPMSGVNFTVPEN